ncbi:MAG: sulfurtransferase [Chloroflexi bacterium]|jgi:thiosulfate/3-mercaptopyruvate sulfurtransferase|nr:sulfurtransferase [Chloroflexota bacterium]
MSGAHARPEMLATPEWLAENLGRAEVRVLDVRWRPDGSGRQVHLEGHVPNAVHLDWRTLVRADASSGAILLADPEACSAALAGVGVGNGTSVVVYDDTASLYAARTWWSLRAYGLASVRILDGGYRAWLQSGRPVSLAVAQPAPATFVPRADTRVRLTTADVRALLGSPEALVLDARAPAEYRGFEGNARRLGHLPGAVNLPAATTSEPGSGRFLPGNELRALIVRAGIGRDRRLVCYDSSGIAAAKLAFALNLMGHDDVAVYDGGWTEWGARLDLPVDR